MLRRLDLRLLLLPRLVPRDQAHQIVTVRAVTAEVLVVEEPLDTAVETHLVGVVHRSHRPAHLAVPAAAEDYYGSPRDGGRHQAQRPEPARLLFSFTHCHKATNCPPAYDETAAFAKYVGMGAKRLKISRFGRNSELKVQGDFGACDVLATG